MLNNLCAVRSRDQLRDAFEEANHWLTYDYDRIEIQLEPNAFVDEPSVIRIFNYGTWNSEYKVFWVTDTTAVSLSQNLSSEELIVLFALMVVKKGLALNEVFEDLRVSVEEAAAAWRAMAAPDGLPNVVPRLVVKDANQGESDAED